MADEKATVFERVKFALGFILFCVMLYVHVYERELSIFWLAVPGVLMGIDPAKILSGWKK